MRFARASSWANSACCLLHGVTGSGKTEVYMRSVQETLARGKTAIVLVPEIALTLWIGRQCRAWFGARFEGVAVLHSALSDVERAREWWRVRHGEARVVVGTRSAVFAPLENLGLIIVDEEQENSFKQEETPRYHGRDVAIVRAKMENAVALLGSATPSLETYHHARNGKYELLTLASRVANRSLASVEIVDLREDFQRTHQTSPISSALHAGIQECLAQRNAGAGADQPARLFVVGAVPQLRRVGAMRELQHLDDLSQAPQPAGVPLLRIDPGGSQGMPEVPIEVRLFFRRRLRASGRTSAQGISRRAHRAARSRHRANQAAVSGNAGRVCRRRARHSGRHANAGEGPRFSARDAGRRDQR